MEKVSKEKVVTLICGEGMARAIKLIRKAKKGVSSPSLAALMEARTTTADGWLRRLWDVGLVEATHGESGLGRGRPPNVYTWREGAEVEVVSVEDYQHSLKSEKTLAKESRAIAAAKGVKRAPARAKEKTKEEAPPKKRAPAKARTRKAKGDQGALPLNWAGGVVAPGAAA